MNLVARYFYLSDTNTHHTVEMEVPTEHASTFLMDFFQEYLNCPGAMSFEVKPMMVPSKPVEPFKGEKTVTFNSWSYGKGKNEVVGLRRKITVE